MQTDQIIQYINHPEDLNEYSLSELSALIKKYPFFETAHALFIVNLKAIEDPRFKEYLQKSSIYIKNRENLLRKINFIENRLNKKASPASTDTTRHTREEEKPLIHKDNSQQKEKEYTREKLRNRISHTISEQLIESDEKNKKDASNADFFILDKSPAGSKQYKKIETGKKQTNAWQDKKEKDKFELDESKSEKKEKINKKKISSEYFNIEDYKEDIEEEQADNDLINQFLNKNPEIKVPENQEKKTEDMSKESTIENEGIISEKLASLYTRQGYYKKAISTYKKLSLKYPEKNDYFAEQIKKLENKINKQQ